MKLFPAIDLYGGKAVRLLKGDYDHMTVYHDDPFQVALDFVNCGARYLHLVDLEGAKDGSTPNFEQVRKIAQHTPLFTEIGGGIRTMKTAEKYLSAGVDRVILGTAAVENEEFLKQAVQKYGEKIAVGVDIKDGQVAIKGWTERSGYSAFDFCEKMVDLGVRTLICTDIAKDGAMQGTNRALYKELSDRFSVDIMASGGVSSLADIRALREMGLYGVIIGKAYYTGAVKVKEALEAAK